MVKNKFVRNFPLIFLVMVFLYISIILMLPRDIHLSLSGNDLLWIVIIILVVLQVIASMIWLALVQEKHWQKYWDNDEKK